MHQMGRPGKIAKFSSHEEFAKNPWPTSWGVVEPVNAGDYRYFYPPLDKDQAITYGTPPPAKAPQAGTPQ